MRCGKAVERGTWGWSGSGVEVVLRRRRLRPKRKMTKAVVEEGEDG
jgi:hypothetical protein